MDNKFIKVKLTAPYGNFPLLRQTPGNKGIWKHCQFFINDKSDKIFDYWVVYDDIISTDYTNCPKQNTILITAEPPSVKRYYDTFVKQFSIVITCHQKVKHSNVHYTQQALPWFAGVKYSQQKRAWDLSSVKTLDDLSAPVSKKKLNKICVITSNKAFTVGHKKRLEFVLKLKEDLPDLVDLYGTGFNPIEDKYDTLKRYKYSLVIENCSIKDYWTEKISDAYISETYPIYYGCTNILDYFDKDSLSLINLDNYDYSLNIIKKIIQNNLHEYKIASIIKSKQAVLYHYNLFELISSKVNTKSSCKPIKLKLRSNNLLWNKLFYLLQKFLLLK